MLLPIAGEWGERPTLEMQIGAVAHELTRFRKEIDPERLRVAAWALRTLEWIAQGEDVLKVLVKLRRERPQTYEALREVFLYFPEPEIAEINVNVTNREVAGVE